MASITLQGASKVFEDGTTAVDALDLEIADGEFAVLVGPSGSGKSTALRMVAGLEEITTGEVRIDGQVVNDLAPKDRDIAMVFQSYALYPHMSVAENLGFALKLRKEDKPSIARRVGGVAGRLSISELLARRPRALSGGQRQRVALGRAVVREPSAFLMDEPLSNLDAKMRVEMRAYIVGLHRELDTTTLYVTHDQVEAMTMGDRVAVMRDGRLEQFDVPQVLYDKPANLFVAGFIGSPAMNLLGGRILVVGNGDLALELGSQTLRLSRELIARRPALARAAGREVVAGIRPEALSPADREDGDGDSLSLEPILVEALGSDMLVHARSDAPAVLAGDAVAAAREAGRLADAPDVVGDGSSVATAADGRVVARLPPSTRVRLGERLHLRVDLGRLHLFDPVTEQALG